MLSRKGLVVWIVALGAAAHLYRITSPAFGGHFYRQHDTAAIARNFYDGPLNIFYPRVDWGGETPGYAETEFQAYTGLVAILYRVFGPYESLARSVNVVMYVLSAMLLYRFVNRMFGRDEGVLAVFFYTITPLAFFATWSIQPDALLALMSLAGIYFFWCWSEDGGWWRLAVSAASVSLAALIKPPALYLGVPLLYLCYKRYGWRFVRRLELWAFAAVAIVPCVLWYIHAYNLFLKYGNTFGIFGRDTIAGVFSIFDPAWLELARWVTQRFVLEIATPIGLVFLAAGVLIGRKASGLLQAWLLGLGLYVVLVPVGFLYHNYYQLPVAFIAAAYMAYGVCQLVERGELSKRVLAALLVVTMGYSAWKVREFTAMGYDQQLRVEFDRRVEAVTEPGSRVIFVVPRPAHADEHPEIYRHRTAEGEFLYCDPIDFYHSHRKGWSIDSLQASPERVEALRLKGARYLATFFPTEIFRAQPGLRDVLEHSHAALDIGSPGVVYRLLGQPDRKGGAF